MRIGDVAKQIAATLSPGEVFKIDWCIYHYTLEIYHDKVSELNWYRNREGDMDFDQDITPIEKFDSYHSVKSYEIIGKIFK